jgi:hypothetical protein
MIVDRYPEEVYNLRIVDRYRTTYVDENRTICGRQT